MNMLFANSISKCHEYIWQKYINNYLSLFLLFFLSSRSWFRSGLRWRLCERWDSEEPDCLLLVQRLTDKLHPVFCTLWLRLSFIYLWFSNQKTLKSFFSCTCGKNDRISKTPFHLLLLSTAGQVPLNEHWSPLWSPVGWLPQRHHLVCWLYLCFDKWF